MNVTEIANDLLSRGLSVIPVNQDKRPTIKSWAEYQSRVPLIGELPFNGSIALICGKVSGDVECFDIDVKHDPNLFERFKEVCGEFFSEIFSAVLVQKTRSGGWHFVYRCSAVGRNQKLARNAAGEVILETRGEAGYFLISPTEGYELIHGDFRDIPTITPQQRQSLFDHAKLLNEYWKEKEVPSTSNQILGQTAGIRPGDDFNERGHIPDLLQAKGWTLVKTKADQELWKRPGNTDSLWSGSFMPSIRKFYVYTSSVPELEQEHAYSAFGLKTYFDHGGDFSAAASALYHLGFGARHERQLPAKSQSSAEEQPDQEERAKPLTRIQKIENWMRENYEFRRNSITSAIICMDKTLGTWKPCNDNDIWRDVQHHLHDIGKGARGGEFSAPISDISNILDSDFVPEFNPFQEYFTSLPTWDGNDHITALADHVQTDNQEFWILQFKKALVRSLACTLDHLVNRIVMVLVQEEQESGKSSFIRFLCPPDLIQYYKEDPINHDKDGEIALAENFIWNLEELDELNKKQISDMKAIISKASIKQRRAYERREKFMPRVVNFWGSTNKAEFLTDTQNTRWMCFNVRSVDHNYHNTTTGVKKIDIHQVWSQAYHLYKSGFQYVLSKEDRALRDARNQEFETMTNEKQIIARFFRAGTMTTPGCRFMPTIDIQNHILQNTHARIQINELNIGRALKQLGYHSDTKRANNKRLRGYWVIPMSSPIEFDNEGQLTIPETPPEPPTPGYKEGETPF